MMKLSGGRMAEGRWATGRSKRCTEPDAQPTVRSEAPLPIIGIVCGGSGVGLPVPLVSSGSSSRKRRSGAAPSRKRQRATSSKQGGPSSGATAEDDWDDVEVVVEPVVVPSDELKGLNCSICFDAMDDGNERVLRLSCPHLFHESCMHGWIMSAIADNKVHRPRSCSTAQHWVMPISMCCVCVCRSRCRAPCVPRLVWG